MALFQSIAQTAEDCWDGNASVVGDLAGLSTDLLRCVPGANLLGLGAGGVLPDGQRVAHEANSALGIDDRVHGEGNVGNHVGTVVGGLLGLPFGPMGAGTGAALGSAAGGWIADLFGDDSNKTTAQRTPHHP